MKEITDKWLFNCGEINELQYCMLDVLENCMFKGEKPFYALTLMNVIRSKTSELYEEIDDFNLNLHEND